MLRYFADKTVLITGAASGIGRALATALAPSGARLALIDLDRTGLRETVALCLAAGGVAHAETCDVSQLDAMRAAYERLPPSLRAIDVVFANAGISSVTEVERFDPERSHRIMSVNYLGTVNAVALALPGMLARRRGHLVATSSLAGYRGLPGSACYGASKAAQAVFCEGLRVDLRGKGVAVSVVCSGFVDTPINKPLLALYYLPFPITAASAARRILRGVARRRTLIAFPLPARLMGMVSKILPNPLYDLLIALNPFKKRPVAPATPEAIVASPDAERDVG